jgi:UDP-glucose:(heptosyl)LPS alpha-1,3-glucosyltransferase
MRDVPSPSHLIVVGRESRIDAYVQRAARAGVADRVTFAGPQKDPKPYYGAADAFVLPTLYDPLPNAAMEAMACGMPVITSTKSGAAELVRGADAGFVCASRDAATLAAHMRALLDGALRARLGANARSAVLPFTPPAMTLQLVLLYKALLEASVANRRRNKARAAPIPVLEPSAAAQGAEDSLPASAADPGATAAPPTPGGDAGPR